MDTNRRHTFDALMLPYMANAYNLACWLTGNPEDAADVVQESYLRAMQFFDTYRGGNARAWLLRIVRNTSLNLLSSSARRKTVPLPEAVDDENDAEVEIADDTADPEISLIQKEAAGTLNELIAALPVIYREVIVLRELEELSYREIADVLKLPQGTVMSRLARARSAIQEHWQKKSAGQKTS